MQIQDFKIQEQTDTVEVSADIDGFRLWYRFPRSYEFSTSGDTFLAAALLPAMSQGEKIEIDPNLPVSPKLLQNISHLQEIFHCWNPGLKRIPISASTRPAETLNPGVFTFFSGGVDGTYSFLKHQEEISHLVFINGFDFDLDSKIFETAVERNTAFVQGFGKALIPVETNHYPFAYRYNLLRTLTQGSALASVALLLGFPRVYVPSSNTYNHLFALGSHPLTDPLWSNECVEIIHDGSEAKRVEKVAKIAEYKSALVNLRVCFDDMNVNCGKCDKCLRTMISLKLLRASDAQFPPLPPLKSVRKMRIINDIQMMYCEESFNLALQVKDEEMRDALRACIQRYERIKLFKEFDRILLGGLIKRAYRGIVKVSPAVCKVDTTPHRN